MADYVQLLRQILTPLVGTVRRIRVALVEDDGTEISPATEAKQDDIKTAVDAVTTKLIAAPSTEAKQDDVITALGSLSTSAKQDLAKAVLDNIKTATDAIQAAVEDTIDVELTGSSALNAAVKNVTTAGTREQLNADLTCKEVTIIAKRDNTGYIYVGSSDVSDTVYGAELAALDSITIGVNNANLIYIDASVNGEGISYVTV